MTEGYKYTELTKQEVDSLRRIFKENKRSLERHEREIRKAAAEAMRRKSNVASMGMSYFEPQTVLDISQVDNRTFNRELCYAMREAMKHTVEVINRKAKNGGIFVENPVSKKEAIGIWCTSLRRFLQESPDIYARMLEPYGKTRTQDIYAGIKWLTDPRNWDDVGKLRGNSYRNDKGSKFVMAEASYWAQDARERIYKEPKDEIESDLRDCKRIISSSESLIKDAEKLNKKADDIVDGLVKVADELAA